MDTLYIEMYKSVILLLVCININLLSLNLREDNQMKVFENRVLEGYIWT
jgi:hypothetical protein